MLCRLRGAAVPTALVIAGCGGGAPAAHRGAEPARSPRARVLPAGRSIRVGALAEGIAVAPELGLVAVATRSPDEIVVLGAADSRLRWRQPIPGEARHLAVAGPKGPLLVPVESANRLLELDLRSRRLMSIAAGQHPHDAAPVAGRIFASDEFGHAVAVIARGRLTAWIPGFVQPGGVVRVGGDVAVIDVAANTVTLIDALTLRRLGVATAGAGPTHAVADSSGDLYVADTRGNAIELFATRPRLRLVKRYPLAGTPYGIAIDSIRRRLWVTLTGSNQLAELAAPSLRLLARYPTGRQPNTVAVDPRTGRVFIADSEAGTVELITPGSRQSPRATRP